MKSVQKTVARITLSLLLAGACQLRPSQAVTERSPQSTPHLTVIKVCAKTTDAPSSSSYRASISSTTSPVDLETARMLDELKKASDEGNWKASSELSKYYATINNKSNDKSDNKREEETYYHKRACQQYIDGATEAELQELEQQAGEDDNMAFALAESYTHAEKRKNLEKASYFYTRAANLGNPDAQWHIANECLAAENLSQANAVRACTYFKACANEFPEANVKIAYMYEKGIGVTESEELAKKYMAEAEQQLGQEAAAKEFGQLVQAEAAKQLKKEQAAAAKELKQLEQEKLKCRENAIKCPNKQCLFQEHEWFFQYRPFYSCPKQITTGQPVYQCESCHQAFHVDCIAHWRKRWDVKRKSECPNPKCCKPAQDMLSQEVQKKQKKSLLAGTAS